MIKMDQYQKKIHIPIPDLHSFDESFHCWIEEKFGKDYLQKYLQINEFHECVVAEADAKGDRKVNYVTNDTDNTTFVLIEWVSEKVHMEYMYRIPIEDRQFYESTWNQYHEHLGTGYKC